MLGQGRAREKAKTWARAQKTAKIACGKQIHRVLRDAPAPSLHNHNRRIGTAVAGASEGMQVGPKTCRNEARELRTIGEQCSTL